MLPSSLASRIPMSTVMCWPTFVSGFIGLVFKNCSDKTSLTVVLCGSGRRSVQPVEAVAARLLARPILQEYDARHQLSAKNEACCCENEGHVLPLHCSARISCIEVCVCRPNAKVSDGSQPPMTFVIHSERNGWLPFAAPSGSHFSRASTTRVPAR